MHSNASTRPAPASSLAAALVDELGTIGFEGPAGWWHGWRAANAGEWALEGIALGLLVAAACCVARRACAASRRPRGRAAADTLPVLAGREGESKRARSKRRRPASSALASAPPAASAPAGLPVDARMHPGPAPLTGSGPSVDEPRSPITNDSNESNAPPPLAATSPVVQQPAARVSSPASRGLNTRFVQGCEGLERAHEQNTPPPAKPVILVASAETTVLSAPPAASAPAGLPVDARMHPGPAPLTGSGPSVDEPRSPITNDSNESNAPPPLAATSPVVQQPAARVSSPASRGLNTRFVQGGEGLERAHEQNTPPPAKPVILVASAETTVLSAPPAASAPAGLPVDARMHPGPAPLTGSGPSVDEPRSPITNDSNESNAPPPLAATSPVVQQPAARVSSPASRGLNTRFVQGCEGLERAHEQNTPPPAKPVILVASAETTVLSAPPAASAPAGLPVDARMHPGPAPLTGSGPSVDEPRSPITNDSNESNAPPPLAATSPVVQQPAARVSSPASRGLNTRFVQGGEGLERAHEQNTPPPAKPVILVASAETTVLSAPPADPTRSSPSSPGLRISKNPSPAVQRGSESFQDVVSPAHHHRELVFPPCRQTDADGRGSVASVAMVAAVAAVATVSERKGMPAGDDDDCDRPVRPVNTVRSRDSACLAASARHHELDVPSAGIVAGPDLDVPRAAAAGGGQPAARSRSAPSSYDAPAKPGAALSKATGRGPPAVVFPPFHEAFRLLSESPSIEPVAARARRAPPPHNDATPPSDGPAPQRFVPFVFHVSHAASHGPQGNYACNPEDWSPETHSRSSSSVASVQAGLHPYGPSDLPPSYYSGDGSANWSRSFSPVCPREALVAGHAGGMGQQQGLCTQPGPSVGRRQQTGAWEPYGCVNDRDAVDSDGFESWERGRTDTSEDSIGKEPCCVNVPWGLPDDQWVTLVLGGEPCEIRCVVPLAHTSLSAAAHSFLKCKGFITWCRDEATRTCRWGPRCRYAHVANPQTASDLRSRLPPLAPPMCPRNLGCPLVDDEAHQRRYRHTCRIANCPHAKVLWHAIPFQHTCTGTASSFTT
ncbi:hypothetical protein DIPPA_10121 [Diplonema papillatum]|nr:hypothetical protein DIPPA_10121 [Diplonema papillatum]